MIVQLSVYVDLANFGTVMSKLFFMSEETLKPSIEEKPVIPVLPLRNTILYPSMIMPLAVGREKSLKALEQATREDGLIFVVSQKDGEIEDL